MEGLLEVYKNCETAKALKSSFKGLKLLKLSEIIGRDKEQLIGLTKGWMAHKPINKFKMQPTASRASQEAKSYIR